MNMYYSPEDFGLTQIAEVDWREEPYEFCLTVLWRDGASKFYVGSDSGCSCPRPFEDYRSAEDLAPVRDLGDLIRALESAEATHYIHGDQPAKRAALVSAYQQARSAV